MNMNPRGKTLALVGGYGSMGSWILEFLRKEDLLQSVSVLITGPRPERGKRMADKYGCDFHADNLKAAECDVIVLCTPLDISPQVLEEMAAHVREGSVVIDICSVKTPICSTASRVLDPGVEYISAHPMFGPSVPNLEGQVVILVPVLKGDFLPCLEEFLERHQARTLVTTCEEHDYALSVVQCLTHFAYISVGATLKEIDFDIGRSRDYSSPVYELMVDMIGRILSGNPDMYAQIQISNPYSSDMEEVFIEKAKNLKEAVDSGDRTAFKEVMIEAAKHYDDLESAFSKSTRAVSALYEEMLRLKDSVGRMISVRNEATGAIHTGVLKSMTAEFLTIGDGKRSIRMKTANASMLGREEGSRRRVEKFGTNQRDGSYLLDEDSEPEAISRMLEKCQDELVSVEPIDVYTGQGIPEGEKSVTFRFTFFGDLDPEPAERRVRDLLESMGAHPR